MAVTLAVLIAFAFHGFAPEGFGVRPSTFALRATADRSAFGPDEVRPQLARVEALPAPPARRGDVVRLVVKVTPRDGIHVYAPPEKAFKPIVLTVEQTRGARVGKPQYPASTVRTFEGERVHVYDAPFSIEVPVTIDGQAPRALAITGQLTYQACDDLICYLPIKVPLRWDLQLQ